MRLSYKPLDDSIVDRLDLFFNKSYKFIEVNPGNAVVSTIWIRHLIYIEYNLYRLCYRCH